MSRKRKCRRERVGPHGSSCVVFERTPGGPLYLGVYVEGKLKKRSLGYTAQDKFWSNGKSESGWKKAVREAHKLAGTNRQHHEPKDEPVTLRQVYELYCAVVTPKQSPPVQQMGRRRGQAWLNFLGPDFDVRCLDVHHWESFRQKRLSGEIDEYGQLVADPKERRKVSEGTAAYSLRWLRDACKVATQRKVGPDRCLLNRNPTDGLQIPEPSDQARHAYTDDECKALLKVAHEVHDAPPTLLTLAIDTGRRVTALCSLRWSDWKPEPVFEHVCSSCDYKLTSSEPAHGACPECGATAATVPLAPNGTLTWRADSDKMNRTWEDIPVTRAVREALEAHRRRFPGVGEAWMFTGDRIPTKRLDRTVAIVMLHRCEKLAKVEHKPRRAWHGFRRRWATVRKHKALKDVAWLGGWSAKDHKALQSLYQKPDADTVLDALDDVKVLRKVR